MYETVITTTIIVTYIIVAWVAYSAGKSRTKEILETKIKRIYGILTEIRKQYVACMQRNKPYQMNILLDKDIRQINPNLEKISSKKPIPYHKRGGKRK